MIRCACTVLASTVLLAGTASAQFVAVTFNGDILSIDQNTGVGTLLFSSGVQGLQGMSYSPANRLWCVQRAGAQGPRLWEIDTVLGTLTPGMFTTINDAVGMALAPNGMLYVEDLVGLVRTHLFVIDLSAPGGATTQLVGEVKLGNQYLQILGMTFSPGGTLFGWDNFYGLVTIDPFTALAADVDGVTGNTVQMQSIAWAPDGFLYGGYDSFFRIDPATGAVAPIGGPVGFGGFRGLEYFDFQRPTMYCQAKLNSLNCVPAILTHGSNSLSGPDDFSIDAVGVAPQKPGLLIWGPAPQSIAFGGGHLCMS